MGEGRRLREYTQSLPDGLASYPECQTKTTVALNALADLDPRELAEDAPEELAALILNPPPMGVWMPATHSDAIFHLVCDKYYPTDELMREWCYKRTKAAADNPFYAAILRVSGPRMFYAMSARTHGLFQRGTYIELLANTGKRVSFRMTFPPRLHNRFNLLSNVPLFRGAAELTGGENVTSRLLKYTETSANYECAWT